MFRHIIPRQRSFDERFDAPGRCIYCGSGSDVILTLEHIVPDGLHGNLVIPSASCHSCLNEIREYESLMIRNQFGMARMALGIHSKKKRGRKYRRPSTFRSTSAIDETTTREREAHPKMPHVIAVGHFSRRAAMLAGDMPGSHDGAVSFGWDNMVGEPDIVSVGPMRTIDSVKFMAKVAHGYAVGCLGVDGFSPYLGNIIRNREDRLEPWYVGVLPEIANGVDGLHQLRLQIETYSCSQLPQFPKTDKDLVIVYVDMFLGYRLPTYEVVVGEVSPSATKTT